MVKDNINKKNDMIRSLTILCILVPVLFVVSCSGDYRPKAVGSFGTAIVIMDSTQWESETANAIREVYSKGIFTLPGYEPMMDLRFRDFRNNDQLEILRKNKNLIIAAPITDSTNTAEFVRALLSDDVEQEVRNDNNFAFPLNNQWYRNQWSVILTSTSDSALARKIMSSEETLTDQLLEIEVERWKEEVYAKGEQTNVSDSVWTDHGWKIRIQHDWRKNIDTTYTANNKKNYFLTMRRNLPQNQRWFWAWWIDGVPSDTVLSQGWINAKRDSLMGKWIRGTRENSYVTTDYDHHSIESDSLLVDNHQALETQGVWRMINDAMAGPFVNMTIYDEEKDRLFMLEFAQFSPKYDKRRFVRQFQAMLRTFKSDSTWNSSQQNLTVSGEE